MKLFGTIIGILMMSFAHIFSWHQLENRKINFKNPKLYVVLFLSVILLMTSVTFVDKFLKIACVTVIFILLNYYLLKTDIKEAVLMPVMTEFMIMIAEMILMVILSIIGKDIDAIVSNRYGDFSINATVSILVICINCSTIFRKLYYFILRETDKISSKYFIAFSFIIVFVSNILAMTVYYKVNFSCLLLFNTFITIIYFIIILHSLLNRNNYLKVSDQYNTTLSNLKEYEDILNKYRVSNHENKNQLLTIRNMVKNKEENIPEYIDTLVENHLKDNEHLLGQSMIIPEGGLRGLVYSKMLLMKEQEIDFDFSIDKAIRSIHLMKLGEQTVLDICKIVGVFLDNAIEAVQKLDEKFIDLEMCIEESQLYIAVTNNFIGTIDLERLEENGYSTKGKEHGYGLSLVKKILESNSLLKNEKRISNDEFIQKLIINISQLQ